MCEANESVRWHRNAVGAMMLVDAVPFLWTFLDYPSIIVTGWTCRYLKNVLDSLLLRYGTSLADLSAFQFSQNGYCVPFDVNESPNLLQLKWGMDKYEDITGCYFETSGCKYEGNCDTWEMHFQRVYYKNTVDQTIEAPESTAKLFRSFLNPLYDSHKVLNHKSLKLIGQLFPDGHYFARWCQLSVYSREEARRLRLDTKLACELHSSKYVHEQGGIKDGIGLF